MAENKKGFVLYADQKETFDLLTDEQAGQLIKIIYSYVNDENPIIDNPLLKLAFTPIKQQLKRDLKKWETKLDKKSIAGIIGNLKRWHPDLYELYQSDNERLYELQNIAKHRNATNAIAKIAVTDTVTVTDNVTVTDKDILLKKETKFNFKKSLIELGVKENIISDWLKVRSKKKASNTETAFKQLKKQIELSHLSANDCITKAVENSWSGFKAEWLSNDNEHQKINNTFVYK